MKKKNHLPVFGVGPLYAFIIILLTLFATVLSAKGHLSSGKFNSLHTPFLVIGLFFIVFGCIIWIKAILEARVDEYILSNKLCTTGIYAYVRNPCYSGIMLVCSGLLFIANNLWLLILPFIYWLFMTFLMKYTEEKWLTNLYGEEYLTYCKKVNRCIPWFKH